MLVLHRVSSLEGDSQAPAVSRSVLKGKVIDPDVDHPDDLKRCGFFIHSSRTPCSVPGDRMPTLQGAYKTCHSARILSES
jgi:hypothetical protein